jgi:integrase
MDRLREIEGNAARALEFTVLTAARTSETLLARRSEIDIKTRMWIVPAKRMKARKDHRVPLCDKAMGIIEAMPADAKYLFPGTQQDKPMVKSAMLTVLDRMGIRDQATTHGFRSAFTDWASEEGDYKKELIDLATAHAVSDQVDAAYRRGTMLAKRHGLMADWERFCNGSEQ